MTIEKLICLDFDKKREVEVLKQEKEPQKDFQEILDKEIERLKHGN